MKKRVVSLLLALTLVLTSGVLVSAAWASDISSHWAKATIQSWLDKGYAETYNDGSFRPQQTIKRVEFASFVNNSLGLTDKADISFIDVKSSDWYYNIVRTAVGEGYMSGVTYNTFKPLDGVTREVAARMMCSLMNLSEKPEYALSFTDVRNMGWSQGFIGAVVKEGLFTGYDNGSFQPKKMMTRAEAIIALDKMNQKLGQPTPTPSPSPSPITAKYDISFYVKNGLNQPIKDVSMVIGGVTKYTNDEGVCTFSLSSGTNYYTAKKDGFNTKNSSVSVTKSGSIAVNLDYNNRYAADIYVRDSKTGSSISGATVNISGVTSYSTNSSGYIAVRNLENGVYKATVSSPGYGSETITFVVESGNISKTISLNPSQNLYSFPVTVTATNGSAIAGALVYVGTFSATTDYSGRAQFNNIPAGNYTVSVSATGYNSDSRTVNISANTSIAFSLSGKVNPTYSVTVSVTSGGVAVGGASVNIGGYSGTTNSSGMVTISGIPAGSYTLSASDSGFTPNSQTINVSSNTNTSIALQPAVVITYNLYVTVVDSGGYAVPNVAVELDNGASSTTDANGEAYFRVTAGTYTVTAVIPGGTGTTRVTVSNTDRFCQVQLSPFYYGQ